MERFKNFHLLEFRRSQPPDKWAESAFALFAIAIGVT